MERKPHAVVVGGSWSELCAGLAPVRAGWTVTIAERAEGEPPGGAGLGLDRRLLDRVTGVDASRIPVVNGNRDYMLWQERLPLVRRLVSSGMAWGRSYLSTDGAV